MEVLRVNFTSDSNDFDYNGNYNYNSQFLRDAKSKNTMFYWIYKGFNDINCKFIYNYDSDFFNTSVLSWFLLDSCEIPIGTQSHQRDSE